MSDTVGAQGIGKEQALPPVGPEIQAMGKELREAGRCPGGLGKVSPVRPAHLFLSWPTWEWGFWKEHWAGLSEFCPTLLCSPGGLSPLHSAGLRHRGACQARELHSGQLWVSPGSAETPGMGSLGGWDTWSGTSCDSQPEAAYWDGWVVEGISFRLCFDPIVF